MLLEVLYTIGKEGVLTVLRYLGRLPGGGGTSHGWGPRRAKPVGCGWGVCEGVRCASHRPEEGFVYFYFGPPFLCGGRT